MNCKKRAANFNAKEETLLVNLTKKYKHILECQQTDMKSHTAKTQVWLKIASEFNGISGEMYRPPLVLRKKYENIKKMVKKKYADEKCNYRKTGGGPFEPMVFTDVDTTVKEILGTRIEGKSSEFDGDAEVVPKDVCEEPLIEPIVHISPQEGEYEKESDAFITYVMVEEDPPTPSDNYYFQTYENNDTNTPPTSEQAEMVSTLDSSNNNWAKHNPKMLKKAKSKPLLVKKGGENLPITNRVSQWAEAKSRLEESRTQFLEKEQELKLQFMREKHEMELHLMTKKAELEMKLMEVESKAKLEFLPKQKIKF